MTAMTAEEKISVAQKAIDDLINLIQWNTIKLTVTGTARYEILRTLRFYRYCVTDGCTPEASAVIALEFIDGIKRDYQRSAPTPIDQPTE